MKYVALIPVKSLTQAKSRLAPYLSSSEREELVLDMLDHVLHTLRMCEQIEHTAVVSADTNVLARAGRLGALPLLERQYGHNPALYAAAQQLQSAGAGALLTISADLPLLAPRDIITMFELARQSDVVLAPSREGTGTNALLARPPLAIPYRFGSDSRARHLEAARRRHLSSALYQSYSLAFDIDTIEDVRELQRICPAWRERPKMTV